MIFKQYYNIGIAVDTENGLLVPVIRNTESKSLLELNRELIDLASRARNGALKRHEMQGGTFTVTNAGAIGGTAFTPIINYPEVAILGVASASYKPVIKGTPDSHEVVARLQLPLVLAFDHRVNDGAAARFLRKVIEALSNTDSLLLEG